MIVVRMARTGWVLALCGLACAFVAESAFGQQPRIASDVRGMRTALSSAIDEMRNPAEGTYDVVALRVAFQADTSRFTTGSGTFDDDLYGGLEPAVDPLPHDAAYFEAHLDFLTDYVDRVSDGIAQVRTHVIPEVVQVPNPMGFYAPTGPDASSDAELIKLALLVRDAWTSASVQVEFDMSAFDPDRTAFILFHAGVGRDVELIGTTLDKTPQDLPSLFFDHNALARLGVPDVEFNGFPVDHTMILPRTETRIGTDFIADEPYLLELSINGLLAASFFNFLGVPDLFDTETGESAIGPFGLMDAQGIFAYRGLFPPEPMAWTKYYLGWTDPKRLSGDGPTSVSLEAVSDAGSSESAQTVVSDAEYFLVENRYRDPENDGLTLHVWRDGSILEQHVENGDEEFNSATMESFVGGVVVGVDNYDWALPGGLDEDGNPLNGGILIWHVDERRLRAGLTENAVNVGPNQRAIDLEEADAAQDIGFSSADFGPQAELGTPFDYYYEGNPVTVLTAGNREIRLYENRFGPDTFPSSETNAGGPSFIVLDEFSEAAAEMSFRYALTGVEGIEPVEIDEAVQDLIDERQLTFGSSASVSGSDALPVFYSAEGSTAVAAETAYSAATEPVIAEGWLVSVSLHDDGPAVLTGRPLNAGASGWSVDLPAETAGLMPTSPLVGAGTESYYVLFGDSRLVEATATSAAIASVPGLGRLLGLAVVEQGASEELMVVGTDGAGMLGEAPQWVYAIDAGVGQAIFGRDLGGLVGAVPIPQTGEILMLLPGGEIRRIDAAGGAEFVNRTGAPGVLSRYPVLVDLDHDQRLDVLTTFGDRLFAFTQSGAVVSGFPKRLPAPVSGQPIVVRFVDEGAWTVMVAVSDGYLYAFGPNGSKQGFPLEVGNAANGTPMLRGGRLYAVSDAGTVKAWDLPGVHEIWSAERFVDSANSSFVEIEPLAVPDQALAIIDESETYNWPNPIEGGSTRLRIRTQEDARVRVKIIDGAGARIEDVEMGMVRRGVPTEVVWQADVASGLYFARFTATTAAGDEETAVVKMAVIR